MPCNHNHNRLCHPIDIVWLVLGVVHEQTIGENLHLDDRIIFPDYGEGYAKRAQMAVVMVPMMVAPLFFLPEALF